MFEQKLLQLESKYCTDAFWHVILKDQCDISWCISAATRSPPQRHYYVQKSFFGLVMLSKLCTAVKDYTREQHHKHYNTSKSHIPVTRLLVFITILNRVGHLGWTHFGNWNILLWSTHERHVLRNVISVLIGKPFKSEALSRHTLLIMVVHFVRSAHSIIHNTVNIGSTWFHSKLQNSKDGDVDVLIQDKCYV